MKKVIAGTCIAMALAAAAPALAQTQKTMTPTMDQCKGGYKADYQKSMKWSKATFDQACNKIMMKK